MGDGNGSKNERENQPSTSTSTASSRKKLKYVQYFKQEWKDDFPSWLEESFNGTNYAYCKLCNKQISITSGKDALKKHRSSRVHLQSEKSLKSQPRISSFHVNEKQKTASQVLKGM